MQAESPYTLTIQDPCIDRIEELKNLIKESQLIENPIQYILINESLRLNSGKAIAQASHAQEQLMGEILKYSPKEKVQSYLDALLTNPRTVIILSIENKEEIYKLSNYLESCNIMNSIYIDEYGPGYRLEPTAIATEYLEKENPKLEIFKSYDLYRPSEDLETISKLSQLQHIKEWLYKDTLTPYLSNRQFREAIYEEVREDI